MNISLKPVLLSALMALPVITTAQAQNWRDLRGELRDDRQEYRQAVRRGDWTTANQKAREIRQDEYRLQRRTNNNWNNGWNNNNNYYYRTNPNTNYNYRYRTYPYYRSCP